MTLIVTSCATLAPPAVTPFARIDAIDTTVQAAMSATGARGLAVAVVDNGKVVFRKAYGVRNAVNEPLLNDTVMYGASLTKSAFAYLVMQLVDEGRLDLDRPIADYLPQPLPSYSSAADARAYAPWAGLEGDERWRKITARILLTHSAGFANFAFLEPDGKLRMHFDPGARYAYSGAGILLLQFVLERGLGLDVGAEMNRRIFAPNGMTRTSLIWRADFRPNLADGFGIDGKVEPHDERSRVRTAGSMDTTINDVAQLAASYVRGDRLSAAARAEMVRPQLPITTPTQFPSLQSQPATAHIPELSAALGVIAFSGPQGPGFFKGGHNDTTANTWVCVEAGKRCVVILSNDVRAEPAFPAIVRSIIGEAGVPWTWEYGAIPFWDATSILPTRK
ncbi:MAG: beta-lactamase family protein [Betaproteobacteria bacterium]|nr:beta-lactamase family protein [Betaproteobacteria bacterium]